MRVWDDEANRVQPLRKRAESGPQGLSGARPPSHLGYPRRPRLQSRMGPSQRRTQAQHHQPRKRHQLPRIHEGGRRPQRGREAGEGRLPLDLQTSHERIRV